MSFCDEIWLEIIKTLITVVVLGGLGYLIKLEIEGGLKKKEKELKDKEHEGEFKTEINDSSI